MRRDVFVFVAPEGLSALADLPTGYQMPSLGTRDEVIATIWRLAPHVDESDPEWLVVKGPDFVLEVSLGSEAVLDSFMFFAPAGDRADPLMAAIAQALGAALFDASSGTLLARRADPRR
jgi:hypothetical protein